MSWKVEQYIDTYIGVTKSRSGLVLSGVDFRSSGPGSNAGRGVALCSWTRHGEVYKYSLLLHSNENLDKLRSRYGWLGPNTYFTLPLLGLQVRVVLRTNDYF